jgi:hypothetical protein
MPLDTRYEVTVTFPENFPKELSAKTDLDNFYSEDDIWNVCMDYVWMLLEENGMKIQYEPTE